MSGLICVTSTSYLLALFLFVIIEIDDPCSGFWFIKSIPEDWLDINIQKYRDKRRKKHYAHRQAESSYEED